MCLTNTSERNSSTMTSSPSSPNNDHSNHILDVMFDYTGNGDDELTLRRGSKLEVLSKDESISGSQGWWTGRLVDSDSVGVFPANFVTNSQVNLRIVDYNDLQIGEIIGIGGFGHVYHGKFGDVDVAIKTAKSLASFCSIQTTTSPKTSSENGDTSNDVQKSLIDGLLREARLFSNLKHRNIIQLFGVSPHLQTRNLYLVMEYAHGGALSHLLQQRQSGLYPTVFLQYAKQIADGMHYLHEEACEHIIHRDLKCSNKTISDVHHNEDLMGKTLKITDFGLARKQLQSSSMSAAGTFAWMSPECIRNNEFSTKSDVWSFGVLLWECLTGELPYQGFDQMQVAFGIATNKYSLPIPSTCPEEFAQLMKNCWKISPQERPTFSEVLRQINSITQHDIDPVESHDESYQSLQQDWRQEIQEMFEELKDKEQEIRDREQAIIQLALEQNHQRVQLQQWEQQLIEREMHLVECELKLLMATINQERMSHQTPKIQKRSGRFMHSILNANPSLSPAKPDYISPPTNFRHLISVCHNNYSPILEQHLPSTLPNSCPTNNANLSNSSATLLSNSPNRSSNPMHHQDSYSSSSTPTTPNLSRLRTLTFHFPVSQNGSNPSIPVEKPARSSSSSKCSTQRPNTRKSKSSSTAHRRFYDRYHRANGEPKWYLETLPSINTNNNNNNDTSAVSSAKSTPILDRPSRKLDDFDELSSSSSNCSTPNERSFLRALFDMNSVLTCVGLGRPLPVCFDVTPSTVHHPLANDVTKKEKSSSSSSTTTTPSPSVKKSHPRTSLSPLVTNDIEQSMGNSHVKYRSRIFSSPARPNSLVLSPSSIDQQKQLDDDNEKYYSAQSSILSTPMKNFDGFHLSTFPPDDKLINR